MGYPTPPAGPAAQSPVPLDYTSGPKPRTVSVKAAAASQSLFTGVGYLMAVTFAETTGSARALAYIHDGTETTEVIAAALGAVSGGGGSVSPPNPGIYFQTGLYLEVVSGTITVAVTFAALVDQLPG